MRVVGNASVAAAAQLQAAGAAPYAAPRAVRAARRPTPAATAAWPPGGRHQPTRPTGRPATRGARRRRTPSRAGSRPAQPSRSCSPSSTR